MRLLVRLLVPPGDASDHGGQPEVHLDVGGWPEGRAGIFTVSSLVTALPGIVKDVERETFFIPTLIVKPNSTAAPIPIPCPRRAQGPVHKPFLKHIPLQPCISLQPTPTASQSSVVSGCFSAAPTLYVLNPTSLAKPRALQHLHADLAANNIDVAIISETWFKSTHSNQVIAIPGYTLYRRDRTKRRGGGVAIYIRDDVGCSLFSPSIQDDRLESLWIKSRIQTSDCYICALYHPPPSASRAYTDLEQIDNIKSTLDELTNLDGNSFVIIAGDFNQLKDDDLTVLGLVSVVKEPTHHGHKLDRVYTTCDMYSVSKVVQSTVKTSHMAIIARADSGCIADLN